MEKAIYFVPKNTTEVNKKMENILNEIGENDFTENNMIILEIMNSCVHKFCIAAPEETLKKYFNPEDGTEIKRDEYGRVTEDKVPFPPYEKRNFGFWIALSEDKRNFTLHKFY